MLPVFAQATPQGARHDKHTHHIVKKGETLWGIAAKHYKDHWKWRKIWNLNKKTIKNPHRIYPGQDIDLDELFEQQQPNWNNPGEEIVLEELLPILGLENGAGNSADRSAYFVVKKGDTLWGIAAMHYKDHWKWHKVFKLNKKSIKNPHWIYPGQVFTLDEPLPLEPLPKEPLTVKPAAIQQAPGPTHAPAPSRVVPSLQSKPVPAPAPVPVISAHVISIYSGTSQAGLQTVVILDKGSRDGIENGHMLTLYRGDAAGSGQIAPTASPNTGYGQAQVFRTFDKTSYATVTVASGTIKLLDIAIKK